MLRTAQWLAGGYMVLAIFLTIATLALGPLAGGTAPLAGIGREPVQIEIAYGTEKREWLEAARESFLATNPSVNGRPIEIALNGIGSREMVTEIVQDELRPTVVSPASFIQIELLDDEWRTRNGGDIYHTGADAPQPLVITPLVVVAWQQYADVVSLDDPATFWQNLHEVLAAQGGWEEVGGNGEWGFASLGQTTPETSNSGIQSLVLQSYGYFDRTSGLTTNDILDADYQAWMNDMQRAVPEFPNSTGNLMQDMIRFGPSKYHFVVVYENLAVENIERAEGRGGAIRVYYPPANILSEHPYAILNAEWVDNDQRQAAALFRDYLLSEEVQTEALTRYGFRPANTAVPFDVAGSPFERLANYGIQAEIAQAVEVPPAPVLNEMINWWRRQDY